MKESQADKIIRYLNTHGTITDRDAYTKLGIRRLAARIADIRRDGIPIETQMREVTNADGSTSRIAAYSYGRK